MSQDESRTLKPFTSSSDPHHSHYGTFDGRPAIGFPQPAPPPGSYYPHHGYQAVQGYGTIAEGRPVRLPKLPCCGIGIGWFLFVIGFFLAAIPWYVGAFILLCSRIDYREKPGLIVCTIGAVLAAIAIIFGVTKGAEAW